MSYEVISKDVSGYSGDAAWLLKIEDGYYVASRIQEPREEVAILPAYSNGKYNLVGLFFEGMFRLETQDIEGTIEKFIAGGLKENVSAG